MRHEGATAQLAVDRGAAGLERVLRAMGERFALPLAITETSIEGDDATRTDWLAEACACVARLRADGVDLRGFTWWPLLDFVDWSFTSGGASVEEFLVPDPVSPGETYARPAPLGDPADGVGPFLRRMGLVRLEVDGGVLVRVPTRGAEAFREAGAGVVLG